MKKDKSYKKKAKKARKRIGFLMRILAVLGIVYLVDNLIDDDNSKEDIDNYFNM